MAGFGATQRSCRTWLMRLALVLYPAELKYPQFRLNRVDASLYIRAFGQRPRRQPAPVLDAIARVWISTLYGHASPKKQKSIRERSEK